MTELTLKTGNVNDYLELLHKIAYTNHKSYPTPGERSISISTSITCGKSASKIELPEAKIYVDVKKSDGPSIQIDGNSNLTYNHFELEQGVHMFAKTKIQLHGSNFGTAMLDYCRIETEPAFGNKVEYFNAPVSLVNSLNLKFEPLVDGLMLKGETRFWSRLLRLVKLR
jgi:hypothetical protein